MTQENGRIAMVVRFPLFGRVVGEKPVSDLRSPTPGPEGPAVAYAPMSQPKITVAAAPEAPVTPPTVAEPVAIVPEPPVEKAVAPAPAPADSAEQNEAKAKSILSMAKSYMSAGMRDKAAAKLNDLIARYPKTLGAVEAKAILATLK